MDEFTGENADIQAFKEKKNISLDLTTEFVPNNPYTTTVNANGLGQSSVLEGETEKSGFFETAKAEAEEFNIYYKTFHAGYNRFINQPSPLDNTHSADWSPKSDPSKFVDVKPEFLNYAYQAQGPKDLEYRLQRIREEQHHSEILANGGFAAKVLGGLVGIATDPMSYIPIIGLAKYAKFAPTILKSIQKTLPGAATYSVVQAAAEQTDKISGNLQDFFTHAAINTVFTTAIFGGIGAIGLSMDKMNLWNLRKLGKEYLDGIGFHLKVDEKGKLTGFKAVDEIGGLSAQKVSFAQTMADSEFSKSGVFKLPYIGKGVYNFLSMPILGTPLPKLLNSSSKVVSTFADRVLDHTIITKGLAEGKVSPVKFETLMKQEFAEMRVISAQLDALHLERNGFEIKNRPLVGLVNAGLTVKNKTAELLGKDLEKTDFISRDVFSSEIENVLIKGESSEHASVNEAAAMLRKKIDTTYKNWRLAHNLPEDWLPPRTAEKYLMRVYDTPYLNANKGKWVSVVSDWLKKADEVIAERSKPIRENLNRLEQHKEKHEALLRGTNKTDAEVKVSAELLSSLKTKQKVLEEKLQNDLRTDEALNLHVEDINALSADEATQLNELTKRRDIAAKEIDAQKAIISGMKKEITKRKASAMKAKTVTTGKKKLRQSDTGALLLPEQEAKLHILEKEHDEEVEKIQEKIMRGEVNPRFYRKEEGGERFILKNPSERLKFRKEYESHFHREEHAKAYFDTILNQTPEDTINQVMGKITGNASENHLKSRTLLLPDEILYKNNFMTKDLMAKVNNYVSHLSRRTHLKTVFNDVTVDGGIEPILGHLQTEYQADRLPWDNEKTTLEEKLKNAENDKDKQDIEKKISGVDKKLTDVTKDFEKNKKTLNHIYEKMMGIKRTDRTARQTQSLIMSLTAMGSLGFVPFTMINDLSAAGLQHGIIPFIRDGVYPIAQSLFGALKTKDSEAIRKTAPSVHLAFQDVLNGYADKNWSMFTNPYTNLGRWVSGAEKLAQFSANTTLTNYFDNGLQRIAGSIVQSEFMRILHAFKAGKMSKKEGLYLRKYGIDYEKWGDRMLAAFKQSGGGKTKVGGYQSQFWQWQDMEAANEFSRGVFRGIQSTVIQRGLADSPFWADNVIGSLIHGFNGWTYASINRYVIPSMQEVDAQKLMGVIFMLGTGYFVSPLRRMARGEEPIPENQTTKQRMFETVQDSGYFSFFMNVLADANIASGGSILENIKGSDRYKDRTRAGLLGPSFGQANRMLDVISAAGHNEMNETDLKKMFRMIPVMNSTWGWGMSKKLAESLELPKNRSEAKALKGD